MARVFDTRDQDLLSALRATMQVSKRSDFCFGYLNLRGWQAIDDLIQSWDTSAGQLCRVLIGMQRPPHDEICALYRQGVYLLPDKDSKYRLGPADENDDD